MANTYTGLQAQSMREYYQYFSKYARGRKPEKKVAWVTSFAPVEILEALDVSYYYPESYGAVIAASGQEQRLMEASEQGGLSKDCCSYSCCMDGCLELQDGPRGTPPKPDVLIATNNQCNTLPVWWNMMAEKYQVPLVVLDYPGENTRREDAYRYVFGQHQELISKMEELSGNKLEQARLDSAIENSRNSVKAWEEAGRLLSSHNIEPTLLFDDISFLVTSRCKEYTSELYGLLKTKIEEQGLYHGGKIPLFWIGYPLWYHEKRYLSEQLADFHVVGSNYLTWWNLDYSGDTAFEQLFSAYNYTFLNLSQESRNRRLKQDIRESGAVCAAVLHNKSCKCDFVSARNLDILQAELEIDMIDRTFGDQDQMERRILMMKEAVCTGSAWI